MSVRTTILDLATAIYDEAVALVGEGREANALAAAALADMLHKSELEDGPVTRPMMASRRTRPTRMLRASA